VTKSNLLCKLDPERRFLILILLAALALRVGYVLFFPWDIAGRKFDPQAIYQDERRYDSVAMHLLAGEGFENYSDTITVVPPVYPLFLASVYGAFGHSFTAVRLIQAIVSALTCVIVYHIGKGAFNKRVGRMATLLAVCYPFFFVWCRVLVTETLTAFLVSIGVLWLQRAAAEPSARNRIVAGCIWGAATLVRGNMLIFFPMIILWAALEFGVRRQALSIGGSIVVVAGLLLVPWTVRNYVKYRKPVLVASYGGFILYTANNPYSLPYEPYDTQEHPPEPEVAEWLKGRPLIEADGHLYERGVRYIVDRPRTFLWSAFGRMTVFWRPVTLDTVQEKLSSDAGFTGRDALVSLALRTGMPFLIVADGFVLGLAYVGMLLAARRRRVRVLYVAVLAFCMMHLAAVVVGNGRFRLPLMPVLSVFGGYAIYAMAVLPRRVAVGQRPKVRRSWVVLLLLGVLVLLLGRALGLGNDLRPVEGPPYEAESFEGVVSSTGGDYERIADRGWTYYGDPRYSGGHAALTAAVDNVIQQRIDKLSPGDYKLSVVVGGGLDRTDNRGGTNRLQVSLNGVSRVLEWSDDGQVWQQLELVFPSVPAGDSLSLKPLAVGGRFIIVDKVGLAED
jgi:4-amino-4-deoxy-L-arabinose transferase-like glycosyltransferase